MVGAIALSAPLAVAGTAGAADGSVWDKLAQCESGGNWSINTGNGYSGGLQFSASTWRAFGGSGSAHQASRSEQIAVAERVLAAQGWNAWPACSRKLGVRGHSADPDKQRSAPATEPSSSSSGGGNYTVRSGDTLSKIAAAHGTSWQALYANNRDVLSNPNDLRVGQTLDV